MSIVIHIDNENDLYEEDASLCSGWFSYKEKGIEVSFFKEGLCMIFLTLTSLLENLKEIDSGKQIVRWVGEDNGAVVSIFFRDDSLQFSVNNLFITCPYKEFKSKLLTVINVFLTDCSDKNKTINNESAFRDLKSIHLTFQRSGL